MGCNHHVTFLKHCTDLEEPQRKIMDELHGLRNKAMEMYQQQEMTDEECTLVWKRIVDILERGKTFLTGPIVGEIDGTINRIEQTPIIPDDIDRVKSWYDLEANNEDTDTGYKDSTVGISVVLDAAYHGKLSTLGYIRQIFPDRLHERDKDGNQVVHFAAEGGHIDCLRYICESFPEMKAVINDKEMNALHSAARGGSLDCLKYLIGQGMNAETRCEGGSTILHEAAYGGSVSTVQYVYETFPVLKMERNDKGQDALYMAAYGGTIDCLTYLIGQGMNTDTRSSNGNMLLHAAAYGGIISMVQYLCKTFPEMTKDVNTKGQGALYCAVYGGRLDCLKYLISQGMETDTRSTDGNTLLHEAVYGGSISTLQYIWETFPELSQMRNEKGKDALFIAACGGRFGCLQYLISHGLDTDTRTKEGNTLLHAAAYGGSVPMVKYIWATFPDLRKERNERGGDILHNAARGGSLDCLEYLISQGMNIDTRSNDGRTVLHEAAYSGHKSVVRFLCKNYFQLLGYKQTYGQTAIFAAVDGGHLDILQYLLSQILDPKQTDYKRHTILHTAARRGRTDIVRYLCTSFQFLIPIKGFKGETAREIARRNGNFDCVEIIQECFRK